jgi:hypothetical protein
LAIESLAIEEWMRIESFGKGKGRMERGKERRMEGNHSRAMRKDDARAKRKEERMDR